jgi:ZIP family zinc transporter
MVELLLAATATALATGLGVIPVAALGTRAERLRPAMLGVASGVMAVAAVAGLALPALDEGSPLEVAAGGLAGVLFLLLARAVLDRRVAAGRATVSLRLWLLVFAVLLVHSLPEGFAIGTAYASSTEGLGLFIVIAIAVQNIPEGTSVAIPMAHDGQSTGRQFWAAVATSAPQPAGAAIAYLLVEEVSALLPVSFGFAAGAMLALVLVELLPGALRTSVFETWSGFAAGAATMLLLSILLGV